MFYLSSSTLAEGAEVNILEEATSFWAEEGTGDIRASEAAAEQSIQWSLSFSCLISQKWVIYDRLRGTRNTSRPIPTTGGREASRPPVISEVCSL